MPEAGSRDLKKLLLVLVAIVAIAFIIWPLSVFFQTSGYRTLIFFLALEAGILVWQEMKHKHWLEQIKRRQWLRITYHAGLIIFAISLALLSEKYIFEGLNKAIEFLLLVALAIFGLKKTKDFLI
ncbi:hypothetical protein [Emcibacter sp.]|uniref:hypothetical protein n=1 Tax=Emcibacter sp. TaxID=1979954 RepID=UPI002AA5EDB2|nr:hypothetical protein [Emcibacter sp.]